MRKKLMASILLLTTVTFLFTSVGSYATKLEDQKKAAEQEKANTEQSLKEITAEKNSVQEEVSALNDSIYEVEGQISELEDQIEELNTSIEEKEQDLEEKQKLLDERLSAAYMNGDNTYLQALFSGGLIKFISNYDMIKQIAEYDNNLINEVQNAKTELENSKAELETSKTEVEEKKSELEAQKAEREEKVQSLSDEEKEAQAKIEEKQNEIAKIDAAVKEEQRKIEEARKKAEEEARKKAVTSTSSASSSSSSSNQSSAPVQSAPPSTSSGSMVWPTRIAKQVNSIYAPAGRSDTSGYYGTAHKGLDINAPYGTPIYAAQAGTVVYVNYSGYGGGWGLYVVIYHGKDSKGNAVYTRYAHASSIAPGIKVGSQVSTGTVIMYAGATGAAEGAHLHFEVCLNGMYSQVSPCPYLGIPNSRGVY